MLESISRFESLRSEVPSDPFASYRPRSMGHKGGAGMGGAPCPTGEQARGFVLQREIARGGFGEVWEAHQVSLGRVIAVKRIRKDLLQSGELPTGEVEFGEFCFQQEAMIAALLDHPNILPIYDLGLDDDGRSLLAMKLVRGRPWDEVIKQEFETPVACDFLKRHLPILLDVCQAVSFAHSRGIVHRDLKPSQVMVGDYGEVLLMDWGLAVIADVDKAGQDGSTVARSGMVSTTDSAPNPAGTVAYMAPEQTEENARNIGPWTDIYLLGATLYHLLTGVPPHTASSSVATLYKAAENEVMAASKKAIGREVPHELEAICSKAMATTKEERFSTVMEFVEAIQAYIDGATRLAESRVLVREARKYYENSTCYDDLGRALVMLERAGNLSSQNQQWEPLYQEVLLKFTTTALENKDLQLARMNSLDIKDVPTRERLQATIKDIEKRELYAARQRRFFRFAAIFLAVCLVAGGVLFTVEQQKSRQSMAESRDAALTARASAEKLMNFLIRDASEAFESMSRFKDLQRLTDAVQVYYNTLPKSAEETPETQRNRATGLLLASTMAMGQNDITKGLAALEEACTYCENIVQLSPDRYSLRTELAQVYIFKAGHAYSINQSEQANQYIAKSKEYLTDPRFATPTDNDYLFTLAQTSSLESSILYNQGQLEASEQAFNTARTLVDQLLKQEPENSKYTAFASQLLQSKAILLWEAGSTTLARYQVMSALEYKLELTNARPWDIGLQSELADLYNLIGQADLEDAAWANAESNFKKALDIQERLSTWENSAPIQALSPAFLHIQLGSTYFFSGRDEEANLEFAKAEEKMRPFMLGKTLMPFLVEPVSLMRMFQAEMLLKTDKQAGEKKLREILEMLKSSDLPLKNIASSQLETQAYCHMLLGELDIARQELLEMQHRGHRRRALHKLAVEKGLSATGKLPHELLVLNEAKQPLILQTP